MRPSHLDEVAGHLHLLGEGKPLRRAIEAGQLHSMVFWGPPGTGKTTLARLLANHTEAEFITLSAVLAGVKDIRLATETARARQQAALGDTVLFVDEVHRFNKAQQDAFLPHIEDGTIIFIGATTENPSFELNNALLSRLRVYVLKSLDGNELRSLIDRALKNTECGLGGSDLSIDEGAVSALVNYADGDARRVLGALELAADLTLDGKISLQVSSEVLAGGSMRRFDKGGDVFYEQISALHKSVRGSSPDAALYWLCRMLDGGCDPLYVARRVVRMASEEIGNADPRGLALALDAWLAQERLGSPEGELAIAQAVVYLSVAPKSNAVYAAYKAAMTDAKLYGSLEVPMCLRNAPTQLMKDMAYGEGYRYAHNEEGGYAAGENYFPDEMEPGAYYHPLDQGLEIKIAEKMARLRQKDKE
jgi:putative ATPase